MTATSGSASGQRRARWIRCREARSCLTLTSMKGELRRMGGSGSRTRRESRSGRQCRPQWSRRSHPQLGRQCRTLPLSLDSEARSAPTCLILRRNGKLIELRGRDGGMLWLGLRTCCSARLGVERAVLALKFHSLMGRVAVAERWLTGFVGNRGV
jgi:hypothetical protein